MAWWVLGTCSPLSFDRPLLPQESRSRPQPTWGCRNMTQKITGFKHVAENPWCLSMVKIQGKSSHPMCYLVLQFFQHLSSPWRIRGAAIYGAPWIPSIYHQYTPFMLALIYQHQPDPSWVPWCSIKKTSQTCWEVMHPLELAFFRSRRRETFWDPRTMRLRRANTAIWCGRKTQ